MSAPSRTRSSRPLLSTDLARGGDALRRAAVGVLTGNWEGSYTVPSRSLYPHQWSWDSAFISIGTARWAPARARLELLTLFDAQWRDGRVPHIAFNPAVPEEGYFPGPAFWRSHEVDGAPAVRTSGIVQPPVHALAAWQVHLAEPDLAFLREIYPKLVAQQSYLRAARRLSGDRLLAIVHPWESGMDNSPVWDEPLAAVPADPMTEARCDLTHVAADERPTDRDYQRYTALARAYRDSGYRDERLRDEHAFLVADPLFNAAYGAAEMALARIAAVCGEDPRPHQRHAEEITAAMTDRLYDREAGLFRARDLRTDRLLDGDSVAGLIPLLLPHLPGDIAARLAATAAARFHLGDGLLPSYAPGGPAFEVSRYWRGPAWVNTNWLVWHGLRMRRPELAEPLADGILRAVAGAGFREYFNPFTGEGHGCRDFSWSAALTLDMLSALETHVTEFTMGMRNRINH